MTEDLYGDAGRLTACADGGLGAINPGPTILDRLELAGIPVVAGFEGVS